MSKQSEQRGDNTQELNRLHELLIAKLNTKKRMIKPYDERFIIGYQTKKKGDDTDWGYLDEEIMRHVKRFINDWHNKRMSVYSFPRAAGKTAFFTDIFLRECEAGKTAEYHHPDYVVMSREQYNKLKRSKNDQL